MLCTDSRHFIPQEIPSKYMHAARVSVQQKREAMKGKFTLARCIISVRTQDFRLLKGLQIDIKCVNSNASSLHLLPRIAQLYIADIAVTI